MGHLRLGNLPRTQRWKQIISLLEDGANLPELADASFRASLTGLGRVPADPGLLSVLNGIIDLATASREKDTESALKQAGAIRRSSQLFDVWEYKGKQLKLVYIVTTLGF